MNAPNRIIDLGIWAAATAQAWALRINATYAGAEGHVIRSNARWGLPIDVGAYVLAEFCDAMRFPHPAGPVVYAEQVNACDGCGAVEESECMCWTALSDASSGWTSKGAW